MKKASYFLLLIAASVILGACSPKETSPLTCLFSEDTTGVSGDVGVADFLNAKIPSPAATTTTKTTSQILAKPFWFFMHQLYHFLSEPKQ